MLKVAMVSAAKPKPKPTYSPQTEQEITLAMMNLALKGPRWVGEMMGEDLDESFEIGETGVSLSQFIRHPIKTSKSTIRKWTVSKWMNAISTELVAEYIWKPRLEHFKAQGKINQDMYDAILDKDWGWAMQPAGGGRDMAYERLEELHDYKFLDDDVWAGIHRQHSWEEFSRFRRRPGRYLWDKVFGKRGTKEAPLYKLSPQKWLGEPLGKALAKTGLGKAIASVKQAAAKVAQTVVATAKQALKAVGKAVAKVAVQSAKWVVTKVAGTATWAAISSVVGGLVGSLAGPLGTVVGFLAGPALTKLTEWALKIACYGCACACLVFIVIISFIVVAVGGAFQTTGPGGMVPVVLVEAHKTVSPTHLTLGATGAAAEVSYTIEVTNKTDKEITGGTLVDKFDPADFLPSVLDHGTWDEVGGTLTWSGINLSPHGSFTVRPKGFIQDTNVDKVVTNIATFTGTIEGESVSDIAMASVVVGNPVGQPPSGWPVDSGCISQGPDTVDSPGEDDVSHEGKEAIDIAAPAGQSIYATHDGEVWSFYWNGTNAGGNYVVILSPEGFKTLYAHLLSINPTLAPDKCPVYVEKGQLLGTVGSTGDSTGPHLHYEFIGSYQGQKLKMESPYIPSAISSCLNKVECNCCFSGFDGACGSAP